MPKLVSNKELAAIKEDYKLALQQYSFMPNYLRCIMNIMQQLHELSVHAAETDDIAGMVKITPAFINPFIEAEGLPPLDEEGVRRLGGKLLEMNLNGGLHPCDAWDLARGLQHWQEHAMGMDGITKH